MFDFIRRWMYNYYSLGKIDNKDPSFARAKILNKKAFAGFKNKYRGREIVLCGAGPSLNKYVPIKNAIHIAVNRAILFNKVKFDYFFACDIRGIDHYIEGKNLMEEIMIYGKCVKFFGNQGCNEVEIPESYTSKFDSRRVEFNVWTRRYMFTTNIEKFPLGNFSSVVFPTLQFILYANCKRIYIVGCDCTVGEHFVNHDSNAYKEEKLDSPAILYTEWGMFKEFARFCYPKVEIISINPVGLKGLFKDIYQ